MNVLIVEDDLDFQSSLADLLTKEGYHVDTAEDGLAAAERLGDADVLVADIGIPGMDGLELCSEARTRYPDLSVVIMTGFDTPHSRSEASSRGAQLYLAKPFDRDVLLAHLRRFECSPRGAQQETAAMGGTGGGK